MTMVPAAPDSSRIASTVVGLDEKELAVLRRVGDHWGRALGRRRAWVGALPVDPGLHRFPARPRWAAAELRDSRLRRDRGLGGDRGHCTRRRRRVALRASGIHVASNTSALLLLTCFIHRIAETSGSTARMPCVNRTRLPVSGETAWRSLCRPTSAATSISSNTIADPASNLRSPRYRVISRGLADQCSCF